MESGVCFHGYAHQEHPPKVHNFTPESGKCHVLKSAQPTANSFNTGLLIHRWNDFLAGGSPIPERLGLSLGKASKSRIFVDGQGKGRPVGEVLTNWGKLLGKNDFEG